MEPARNSAKLPTNKARAHSAEATAAAAAETQKPARRPNRPMNSDITGAVTSDPTTTIEIGSVASAGSCGQHGPGQAGDDDVDRELRPQHGLREDEHGDVALGAAVVGRDGGIGDRGTHDNRPPKRCLRLTYGRKARLGRGQGCSRVEQCREQLPKGSSCKPSPIQKSSCTRTAYTKLTEAQIGAKLSGAAARRASSPLSEVFAGKQLRDRDRQRSDAELPLREQATV